MATQRTRVSIEQRRSQILSAALTEFSHKGLHGGSTVNIAKEVGISHPNLFRVFSTKKELFRAVLGEAFARVERDMLTPGEVAKEHPLAVMADAWDRLMRDRELMLILLQGYAATADPDIRDLMDAWTRDLFERAEALPGVSTDEAHDFVAAGMLYLVAASMDLHHRAEREPWAERFLASGS